MSDRGERFTIRPEDVGSLEDVIGPILPVEPAPVALPGTAEPPADDTDELLAWAENISRLRSEGWALCIHKLSGRVTALRTALAERDQRLEEVTRATVVQAGVTGHPPTATKLFDAYTASTLHEEAMFEALLTACGIDPDDYDSWPLETWAYDWYDNSFEFYGCRNDWAPTDAQLQACFALGFSRCWINYLDGTERSAGFGNGKFWPLGERRRGVHREPREEGGPRNAPVAKLNELRAALAALETTHAENVAEYDRTRTAVGAGVGAMLHLADERERLHAEVGRLTKERDEDKRDIIAARADNAILRATIAKLVASNEELTNALAARESHIAELRTALASVAREREELHG